jgi:hypothetical protein
MGFSYMQDYVRFFLQNNSIASFPDIRGIADRVKIDSRISNIIEELQSWPNREIRTHKDFTHPLHKISFLAELGFSVTDPDIKAIYSRVVSTQSSEGPFQLLINIPKSFGGSGQAALSWILSDAPLLTYSIVKLNNNKVTKETLKAVDFIASLVSENGWHCIASKNLGGFHGPGRKSDPCPYATLLSLKMLSLTASIEYIKAKHVGISTLLELWDRRKETKPYLFGMGTDFAKLKLPFVWYDILHVVDVLSTYPEVHQDNRFLEMVNIIRQKRSDTGYIPESVYLAAKEWDFGQKKIASEYMNAVVERIEKRLNAV